MNHHLARCNSRSCRIALILVAVSGCLGDGGDDVASRAAAIQGVTWMNVVGAAAVDDDLSKTDTGTLWNAGAASVQTLAGDGYAEFTTGESTTQKMVGLSSGDAGQHYSDIDFALYLKGNGTFDIDEAGVQVVANAGTYAAGDLFRVQVLAGVVTYWKNGALVYTSTGAPVFPLLVDTSLRTPGATVYNVHLQDLSFWTDAVGVSAVANDLSKTAPETTWKAGASSLTALDGDGFVEFTTGERTTDKVVGLNHLDKNQGMVDIDFGIFLRANGRIAIREKGVDPVGTGFGPYQVGDIFRIDVTGGLVTYARNGTVFYTSLAAPSFPLVLDTSLRTPGATILDARVLPAGACSLWSDTVGLPRSGGLAMKASGDRLVIAAAPADNGAPPPASVYRRLPGGWFLEQDLTGGEVSTYRQVTGGLALDGGRIAIGNPYENQGGVVRVFEQDGTQWNLAEVFDGCPAVDVGEFGRSVAMRGDLMAVSNDHDRVYIFRHGPTGWKREAWLTPPSDIWVLFFGERLAIAGDRVFVGWVQGSGGRGAVYVYRFDPTLPDPGVALCNTPSPDRWVLETILVSPNAQVGDDFPSDLDVNASGTLLLAGNEQFGSADEDTGQQFPNGPGEAYVYQLTPGGWQATATLVGSAAEPDAFFGYSVAFGGADPDLPSFAVIGAPDEGPGNESDTRDPPGGAYLFRTDGGTWFEASRLPWPGPSTSQEYGKEVTASADTAFVFQPGGVSPGVSGTNIAIHDLATCAP